ncbi:MAG: hypothetical protein RL291_1602 [Pseudomonadota bacterium]
MTAPAAHMITQDDVGRMVEAFYEKIWADPELGPIFSGHITDRPHHLATMKTFWGAVLMKTGAYHGRPVPKHVALKGVRPEHFRQWLGLFKETADSELPPEAAATAYQAARVIAGNIFNAMDMMGRLERSET